MLPKRLLSGSLFLFLSLSVLSTPVAANSPATPQTEECTVAPIAIDGLQALVLSGTPVAATPSRADAAVIAPDVAAGVTATIRQSIACTNANQPLRALALFTNAYLIARFSGAGADDLGHLTAAATRDPAPATAADRLRLVSMGVIEPLSDGRVSVVVTTANVADSFTDTLTFAKTGVVWLIDETHTATPPRATPAVQG